MKIEYGPQVIQFLGTLAPEPRRAIVRAMKDLPKRAGDIKALEGQLGGFLRLRVKGSRDLPLPPQR